jgi:hypothetical protein
LHWDFGTHIQKIRGKEAQTAEDGLGILSPPIFDSVKYRFRSYPAIRGGGIPSPRKFHGLLKRKELSPLDTVKKDPPVTWAYGIKGGTQQDGSPFLVVIVGWRTR